MAGDASAYAALGLQPGADGAAIEQAYKRLIKQHHPDREGGDGARAAEINRAYRDLRATRNIKDPLELNPAWPEEERRGRIWMLFALMLAVASVALLIATGPYAEEFEDWLRGGRQPAAAAKAGSAAKEAMDEPLHTKLIDSEIARARELVRTKDEMELAAESTACHRALRAEPSVRQLDRCAAFDETVIELQDRDPLRNRGPFAELTVTRRLWSGASALSGDYLAIDTRLDRVRLRVELALAPREPRGVPASGPAED